jgi:uncharacterized protein
MDLTSRLRSIVQGPSTRASGVRPGQEPPGLRELTYEPDDGYRREAAMDLARVGEVLGGTPLRTPFGECLVIDRRYEGDRLYGSVRIEDCELTDDEGLRILDPVLAARVAGKTVFLDLETTGLSGGAGTVAFLVGCGYFDLGAFQLRQFLLTSYAAERALLSAVAGFFEDCALIVTYNGKTFDVPVMETRWAFHRIPMPIGEVRHFDMLHPARRLWRRAAQSSDDGCRLTVLERILLGMRRVGDVPGFEIPDRYFHFLRSGDARPLEPVLEHNRLDLVSLAAVTARAANMAIQGDGACRDDAEALALGRIYERAQALDRAESCYRRAVLSDEADVRGEALCRLALRCRRERRFAEAAELWRALLTLTEPGSPRRPGALGELRQVAVEALAIHHEHRDRDLASARELALFALEEGVGRRADGMRHRIARLDRKLAKKRDAQLFTS